MGDAGGAEIPVPERIAQYRVGEKLGEGGMGVVFSGRDEVLERDVAVKLLRADRTDARAKERMLREAKALAKLSHPNIVPIYGAGEENGLVYLAMERVEGRSLRDVRDDESFDWQERLRIYLQAARGLAAAHAADMVHRDFKPSNVLVGADGRVRVLDFGLARAVGAASVNTTGVSGESEGGATDPMAGTPAYMAPEQRVGEAADARADQYSFCVALWEALFGHNPIRKTPLIQIVDGELALEVPSGSPVPSHVVRALEQGLRREPAQRHASMDALRVALEAAPVSRRPALWIAMGGLGVAGAIGWGLQPSRCEGVELELAPLYGAGSRDGLLSQWADTGLPEGSREVALGRLDAFVASWGATRLQTCRAHEDGETSDERYDQQQACLAERRAELRAVLTIGRSVEVVTQGVYALREPSICEDLAEVGVREPPPPRSGQGEQRLRLREAVAEVRAHLQTVDLEPVPALLVALERDAQDDAAMQAEVALLRGRHQRLHGQWVDAAVSLKRAFEEAEACGYKVVSARAAVRLVNVVGDGLAKRGEGDVWVTVANTKLRALADPELAAELALARGSMAITHADFGAARPLLEEALGLAREAWGPEHLKVASVHAARGALALSEGRLEDATAEFERTLQMRRAVFGDQHPQIADSLSNLANVSMVRGGLDEAEQGYREAIAMMDATNPGMGTSRAQAVAGLAEIAGARGHAEPARAHFRDALESLPEGSEQHPARATILALFASLESREGDYQGAVRMAREALEIQTKVFGAQHPHIAATLNGLGTSLQSLKRYEEAKRVLQRSVDMHRALEGARSAGVAPPLSNLALIEHAQGNLDVARTMFEEVLSLEVEELGPEHPNIVFDYYYLAQVELAAGKPSTSVQHLLRARAIHHPSAAMRAEVSFALAQSQVEAKLPWREDAKLAREAFVAMEDPKALELFDAWVAEQG
ncbi:MAG: protein kinase domain-containing protein [Nannocystales bacterium]